MTKELYQIPLCSIFKIEQERVICLSGNGQNESFFDSGYDYELSE